MDVHCIISVLDHTAYDGPQSYDTGNPDSTVGKMQVLHVTKGSSRTDPDSDDDHLPTISPGTNYMRTVYMIHF